MLVRLMVSAHRTSPWPLLLRPTETAPVADGLTGPTYSAQLIVGPPGVGKTTLAESVARHLGREIVRVIALPELQQVPLAAWAPALAALGIDDDPGAALPALIRALATDPAARLVLVDDAPWLDDVSSGAVYQLVRAFGVPTILTARLGEPLPRPLQRLLDEGLAATHSLSGFTPAEVDSLLEARFGRRPRHADVVRITDRTAGNALYVRVLVEGAVRAGSVRIGESTVEVDDGATPASLLDSVGARIAGLDSDQRRLLHVIALTQPIERALVAADAGRAATVDQLVDLGLVTAEAGGEPAHPHLRIAHPLFADVLRDDPDREEVARVAAACLLSSGLAEHRLSGILLLRRTSTPPAASDLAWAAGRLYATGDVEAAVVIAREAELGDLTPAERFSTALHLANAHSALGALDDADAHYARADLLARRPEDAVLLAGRRGEHLAFRRFDVEAAVAQADAVHRTVPPDLAVSLDADLRLWRAILGQVHDHATDLAAADSLPEAAVRSAMASIMTESMGGRSTAARDAAALLATAQERLGVLDPAAAAMVGFNEYIHLLSTGEHEKALAFAQARRSDSGDGVGIWTSTVAEHRNYNGRLAEAHRLSLLAVDQCRWRDVMGVLGLALAVHADILAKSGEPDRARAVLASMEPGQRAEPKAALLVAECEAWLAHTVGQPERAEDIVVQAAHRAVDVGFRVVAAISLGLCIRLGRTERAAEMLGTICSELPSDFVLYTSLRDLAVALRDRQPGAVALPARRLADAGMAPTALDAIALALRMGPRSEDRRRLERLGSTIAVGVDSPLVQSNQSPPLTDREYEIAVAAAARERSREIAARLGISVRTVDNQLQSVYRKLGVSSRDELRAVLDELRTSC